MIRPAVLLGLLAACAQAPEPAVTIHGVVDGHEPVVRVYLRSLGSWETLQVEGKGGLRVTEAGASFSSNDPVPLRRDRADVVLEPLEGVVFVADRTYSGRLLWADGYLVNEVALENYILGVLRGELPLPEVPEEAAGAQAIAARSYTMHYLAQARPHYDVDDTTLFQRYVGMQYAPDDSSLRAGVRATTGLFLDYKGHPLKAYYHSTCGGHTTDVPTGLGREPMEPMGGVECGYCRASKYWRWKVDLTDDEILRAADLAGSLRSLQVAETGPGERASRVAVTTEGQSLIQAGKFRLALGGSKLRSTRILKLVRVDGGYRVEGAGWGHGVGLCQMGALGLAQEGKSATDITSHYYPGATLRRAY